MKQIDEKIIAEFIRYPTTRKVDVPISEEQYKSTTIQEYIRGQYRADWDVNFSYKDLRSPAEWARGDGYNAYYLNLMARDGR